LLCTHQPGQEEGEKHQKKLIEDCNDLAKREFYCETDARMALDYFLAKQDTSLFELNTEAKEEQVIKRRVLNNFDTEY
jgi:hypothetical protein